MAEYIREVEKIIDDYHKHSSVFSLNRKTALFNALTVFEDSCRIGGKSNLAITGDELGYSFLIREQLDALNVLIQWIFQDCPDKSDDILDMRVLPERYIYTAYLFQQEALPYSPICSAYISYSRHSFSVKINEKQKKLTFLDNPDNRNIVISDIAESILRDQKASLESSHIEDLALANRKLIESIEYRDEHISYSMDDEIWCSFQKAMEWQWSLTSDLPEDWKLDACLIKDLKKFWIAIATLCFIHTVACLNCGKNGGAVGEAVLIKSPSEFVRIISDKGKITNETALTILNMLTYNSHLKNNDIMYQPFIKIDNDKLALAPHLLLASRPERNFISLIHKLKDKSYFDLTNLREGMMQDELDAITEVLPNTLVAKNRPLPDRLPDVDYAIWNKESNCILVCELKWLVEPDSTTEIFARIQDLEHGCKQMSDILCYANSFCQEFCNRVFGTTKLTNVPKIVGCVVSKKGIRVEHSEVPVISLQALTDILKCSGGSDKAFESIERMEYLMPAPSNFEYGLQTVCYAGYTFEIPALIKDNSVAQKTYKRVGRKIGRNEPCPCGSGKKYKKCCGR